MKRRIGILALVLLIIGLGIGGVLVYKIHTPEYVLLQTFVDLQESGVDGLEEHMTANGWSQVEKVRRIADNPVVIALSSAFSKQTEELLAKIKSMDWTIKDILKGKQSSEVVIQFTDHKKITGTIRVLMKKEENQWKIDQLDWPQFEQFSL